MSGLEVAALGALGAAYVDSRFDVLNDLFRVKQFGGAVLKWAVAQKRSKVSVFNVFEQWALTQPHQLFLVFPEPVVETSENPNSPLEDRFIVRRYTYGETYELVQKYASYLVKEHGIKRGDTVAIDMVNKPEYIIIWLALWNIGAIPAMINYNLQGKSLSHCVRISNSKVLIADYEVADAALAVADELKKELGVVTVVADKEHYENIFRTYGRTNFVNDTQLKASDPSCFIFTSGTTGLPKAANMSWRKAYWGSTLYGNVCYYSRNDILYSAMPLYHSTAAVLGFLATLHKGGTYAIGHKFSTTTFWTQARITGATAVQYVGETCRYLLNAPESPEDKNHKVRVAHGNGMRPDVWLRFKERFNVAVISEFYGATEFPSAITNYQQGSFGVGACASYGSLVTFIMKSTKWNIAAVDQDTQDLWRDPKTGFGRFTKTNEPGEFLFRIDANDITAEFQGYAGNKKATEEKVAFDVFKKGDAWVRSGDLLKFDENDNVLFVDRLGDTFRWKSENVSTNEVEEAVCEFPGIDICVCVGVKVPEHEGRAGFAVIKLHDPKSSIDMTALAKYLLSRLPRYAVPIFIKFVNEVGGTGNNKVQKKTFRDQKIPAPQGEVIWWLVNGTYTQLTPEAWARVEQGAHKL